MTDNLQPFHRFATDIYQSQIKKEFPFKTIKKTKPELDTGDIIVEDYWYEGDEGKYLYYVARINKKSVTLLDCDQYGNTLYWKRRYGPSPEYAKQLYKCSDKHIFEVLDWKAPSGYKPEYY